MFQVKEDGIFAHIVAQQFSHEWDSMGDDCLSSTGLYMGFGEALKQNMDPRLFSGYLANIYSRFFQHGEIYASPALPIQLVGLRYQSSKITTLVYHSTSPLYSGAPSGFLRIVDTFFHRLDTCPAFASEVGGFCDFAVKDVYRG